MLNAVRFAFPTQKPSPVTVVPGGMVSVRVTVQNNDRSKSYTLKLTGTAVYGGTSRSVGMSWSNTRFTLGPGAVATYRMTAVVPSSMGDATLDVIWKLQDYSRGTVYDEGTHAGVIVVKKQVIKYGGIIWSSKTPPTQEQIDAMLKWSDLDQQAKAKGYAGTSVNPSVPGTVVTYKPDGSVLVTPRSEWLASQPRWVQDTIRQEEQRIQQAQKATTPQDKAKALGLTQNDIEVQRRMIRENPNIDFGNRDIRKLGLY